MQRTASALLMGTLVLLMAPAALALGLDASTHGASTNLDADVPVALPPVDVPTPGMPIGFDGPVDLPGAGDAPTAPHGDGISTSTSGGFVPISPDAQKVATVATAGASFLLLAGLLAHVLGVPLFSRIKSSHLLDNEVRQRVHEAVVNNPGVTIKEVTSLCSVGWGTAVYHLKRLETERLIVSERQRQFRRFFKNGGGIVNDDKGAYGELKNPTSDRIARQIISAPGTCQKDLCEAVGISAPLASKYLGRLAEAGLLTTERAWKSVKYFPTPKLEDLLQVNSAVPVTVEASVAVPVAPALAA